MKNGKKTFIVALALIFSASLVFSTVYFASDASAQYKITTSLPGTTVKAGASARGFSIAGYVAQIYRGALALVGIVALGAIVFWGIKYTISGGNASKISDARDGITQALLGVVLLLSAYILLRLINPALVNLSATDARLSGVPDVPKAGTSILNSGGAFNGPQNSAQVPIVTGGAF